MTDMQYLEQDAVGRVPPIGSNFMSTSRKLFLSLCSPNATLISQGDFEVRGHTRRQTAL